MNALEYAIALVEFDSTCHSSNAAVSDFVEETLQHLGCETERIEYIDENGVLKINVLGRKGDGPGGLAYFGHTDVVVSDDWAVAEHGPFTPTVGDGRLYGRGSTDMKGSIACMLAALEGVLDEDLGQPVYISCSSDEEINHRGAIEIAQRSRLYRELVEGDAVGIVGEPTEMNVVYAHKGGCRMTITSHGRAAHSSTREGLNANLAMIPFLAELKAIYDETENDMAWRDDEFDPPTVCLNFGINDHTEAINITPPQSICTIGFRPMPNTDVDAIVARIRGSAEACGIEFKLENTNPAFRRDPQSEFMKTCVELSGGHTPRTVAYGSEASNFAEIERLVVLGPGDIKQAHKSDEWISLDQLQKGEEIYGEFLRKFCV